jgi:hypothetical protein
MSVVSENVDRDPEFDLRHRCGACGDPILGSAFVVGLLFDFCTPCEDVANRMGRSFDPNDHRHDGRTPKVRRDGR